MRSQSASQPVEILTRRSFERQSESAAANGVFRRRRFVAGMNGSRGCGLG